MDYKKEYENAFAIAKDWYNDPKTTEKEKRLLEAQYPELKENEDERIRKELLDFCKNRAEKYINEPIKPKYISEWIAWLEKQGSQNLANSAKTCKDEQQPTNKVEPKFKVGDWLIGNNIVVKPCCITQIHKPYYYLTNENSFIKFGEEDKYHLWTIQDAKDGDVLSFNDGHGNDCIELIKSITNKKIEFWFCLTNGNRYEVFDGIIPYTNLVSREDATPATKEQRDLLFQKMHEAGYTWDAEKKELTKIEQKSIEKPTKGNYYTCIKDYQFCEHDDMTFEMGKIYKCEEDGKITADNGGLWPFINITGFFRLSTHEEISSHIKKSVEWSDEDKGIVTELIGIFESAVDGGHVEFPYRLLKDYIRILKLCQTLPQSKTQWKPSEEQLMELHCAICGCSFEIPLLVELEEQLKKL